MNVDNVSRCTAEATFLLGSTGSYTTSGEVISGPMPLMAIVVPFLQWQAASSTPRNVPNLTTRSSQRYPENPLASCSAP